MEGDRPIRGTSARKGVRTFPRSLRPEEFGEGDSAEEGNARGGRNFTSILCGGEISGAIGDKSMMQGEGKAFPLKKKGSTDRSGQKTAKLECLRGVTAEEGL